jgi:hypothetical protein
MSAPKDLDLLLKSFLSEGPMELPDPSYDEVRSRMEQTRQRAYIGSWRTLNVNNFWKVGLAVVAVVAIAVVAYNLLPGVRDQTGQPWPSAVPSASPGAASLAAGSFGSHGGNIQLDATGGGSNVTGSMIYADQGGAELGGFVVDLQCTRQTEGGLIFIGGPISDSTKGYATDTPVGTNIALILQRGSPVTAEIFVENPDPHEPDCMTFLQSIPNERPQGALEPIVGAVELGP